MKELLEKDDNWDPHLVKQKDICKKYTSKWSLINKKLHIGISNNYFLQPVNGLRHSSENGTVGWYIWFGEFKNDDDFFKPMCAEHLLEINPNIIQYLGLDVGFRFLIDCNGYEDVWEDENIK